MDFTVSEKLQTILDMMKEFVEKELIPMEPEFATRGFLLDHAFFGAYRGEDRLEQGAGTLLSNARGAEAGATSPWSDLRGCCRFDQFCPRIELLGA